MNTRYCNVAIKSGGWAGSGGREEGNGEWFGEIDVGK